MVRSEAPRKVFTWQELAHADIATAKCGSRSTSGSGATCWRFLRGHLDKPKQRIIVVKIGGSILTGGKAYRRAAEFLEERLRQSDERFVVVVSAQNGMTDTLERAARQIVPNPDKRALDLLWATGELGSVGLLTIHLHRLSVPAVGFNVHETGLRVSGTEDSYGEATLNSEMFEEAFRYHRIVVVPGFLATNASGSIVSLGRGGSDLTAVLLSIHLGALRCELVKGVGGYFTRDPRRDVSAVHIRTLTHRQALEMAANGCELVQRQAIAMAAESNLPIFIRGMGETDLRSVISSAPSDQHLPVDAARELSVRD
jgi:aspartate kinase